MPYSTTFGTGFEMGEWMLADSEWNNGTGVAITTSNVKSGSYALSMNNSWARFPFSPSSYEVYGGIWLRPATTSDDFRINFQCQGGGEVSFRINATSGIWQAYRSSTLLASGSSVLNSGVYYNIQFYAYIHGSSGRMVLKINESTEIDFTGNTDPTGSAGPIWFFRLQNNDGVTIYIDNLTLGTGDFPGDRRFEALVPNVDGATTQWTGSQGGYYYTLVDDIPPDDNDYLYTTASGNVTILGIEDFSGTGKTIENVYAWFRSNQTSTSGGSLNYGVTLSGNDILDTDELSINYEYYYLNLPDAPASSGWTNAELNNLEMKIVSSF